MTRVLLACFIAFLYSPVFAYTGFGVCNYGKESISSVVCNGPTVLKETTINGDIKITGSLQADSISVKSIMVTGSTQLSWSQVSGTVKIVGALDADHVEFKQGIAVESDSINLDHTKINGLLTVTSSNSNPYVQVTCGSTITGSVFFDGKPGVVQVTGDSIVQGKVVNGSLEFVKRPCSQ